MRQKNNACRSQLRMGASAIALLALAAAAPAMAQTTAPAAAQDDATVEEVVVTGIRASLQSAQQIKQNSEQLVDSITAVDIGRMPDVNVAEALQRISGIQITRNYGEGNGIAIRGLTDVRTELNGRDIFSASGGRGLSWEEVGSELLAGVDVYKNPSAELIEGGLSGTVNLRTRMPFDSTGRVFAATVGYTNYDLIEDDGKTLSFLASDRWNTNIGEIGLMANVSYGDTSFRKDTAVVEPFWERTDIPGFVGQDNIFVPAGGGISTGYGSRERLSAAFAAQWRPNDDMEFYAQILRADYEFHDHGVSYFVYGPTSSGGTMRAVPGTFTFGADGVALTGAYSNPSVDSVVFGTNRDTTTTDYSIGGKWNVSDRLKVSADLQYLTSKVDQETMNLTASVLNANDSVPGYGGNWQYNFDISDDIPRFTATPGYLANADNYGLTAILPYREKNDADSYAGRVDLTWDFDDGGLFRDFRGGFRATNKEATNRNTTYGTWTALGSCANWSSAGNCNVLGDYPAQASANPFTSSFLRGKGSDIFGPIQLFGLGIINDPQSVFDFVNGLPTTTTPFAFRSYDDPGAVLATIEEKTYAAYGVLRFGSTIGGMEWDGNGGARLVKTESVSNGVQTISYRDPASTSPSPGTITLRQDFSGEKSYTKLLPSLNLRLHITDELQLRFAASRNMSRPSFSQLNAQVSISPTYANSGDTIPTGVGTGTAQGNPNLNPQMVDQFDVALEWYFSKVGHLYGTAFKKDISDLIFQANALETYDLPGIGPTQFNVNRFVNLSQGKVKGFEVGGQYFFDFLPGALSGFGVQANYTYVDSNASTIAASDITGGAAINVPIPGLSKNSYNLIALYEKYGFNARLAYNWRDDFLVTTQSNGTGNLPIFAKPYGSLDASISYDFSPHIALTIDGQNLTNEVRQTYQGVESRPRDYEINDRRFSARIRFRY